MMSISKMTADELVEKVARELCTQNGDDPDETMIDPDTGGEISNWTVYSSDARAAVALVVEECARAVGDHNKAGREWVPGSLWDSLTIEAQAAYL